MQEVTEEKVRREKRQERERDGWGKQERRKKNDMRRVQEQEGAVREDGREVSDKDNEIMYR